jgi:uncharacterized protein
MLFVIQCVDKPGQQALRASNRPAHLDYLNSFGKRIVIAGPTLIDDGSTPTGSVIVIEAADAKDAASFAAGDPYAKAGLFASTTIVPWRKVIMNPPPAAAG